jgi:hypothetical protein
MVLPEGERDQRNDECSAELEVPSVQGEGVVGGGVDRHAGDRTPVVSGGRSTRGSVSSPFPDVS